jgi:hypothetical protein
VKNSSNNKQGMPCWKCTLRSLAAYQARTRIPQFVKTAGSYEPVGAVLVRLGCDLDS